MGRYADEVERLARELGVFKSVEPCPSCGFPLGHPSGCPKGDGAIGFPAWQKKHPLGIRWTDTPAGDADAWWAAEQAVLESREWRTRWQRSESSAYRSGYVDADRRAGVRLMNLVGGKPGKFRDRIREYAAGLLR